MKLSIVDLDKDRLSQTAQIWHAGWHEAHAAIMPAELAALRTIGNFTRRLENGIETVRVGIRDDAVLGFCMTQSDELYQMYVSPGARGLGLAQALLADGEARILAAGHASAWLACAVGNDRAARFYEKSGWKNAGVRSVDLDTSRGAFPMDVWRFEKKLSPAEKTVRRDDRERSHP